MNFKFGSHEEKLRREIKEFAEAELPPRGFGFHESGYEYNEESWPLTRQIAKKLAAKGWLAPGWPKKYGGGQYSPTEELVYWEEMAYNRVPGIDVGVGAVMWVGPALLPRLDAMEAIISLVGRKSGQRQPKLPIGAGFWPGPTPRGQDTAD
jgi:alkylation response protein AidB-like acyl-CoA dehydrogenase